MLQAGGLIIITLSDRVQLSQCFAREFSHAKVTLLPESRRDRYRTYELNKTNIAIIVVILAVFPFRKFVTCKNIINLISFIVILPLV